jgi:hypothetical protein
LWVKKENIMEIHGGKTMLTFLDKNKDYKLYDEQNRILSTMKGEELYAKHYDQVEAVVRERYEKSKKQAKEMKPVKTTEYKKR